MDDLEVNTCLGEMYFKSLKKYSDKILLYIGETDESITYSEILSQSVRTALRMRAKGITRKDMISICSHNQKYSCLPIIASQYLGAICANFDPSLSHIDTVHLLKLSEPKMLFVSEEAVEFMESCVSKAGVKPELIVFGSSDKYSQFTEFLQPDQNEQNFEPVKIDSKETAMLHFSSGTTGLPKGICLNHRSIIKCGTDFLPYTLTNTNPPVSLMFATFYWITSDLNLVNCVTNGYATVMCKKFDALFTWKLIEKYKVTFTFLAPYNAALFLKEKYKNFDCSSVEVVITGSCPVTKQLMDDLAEVFHNAAVLNVYGQTENSGILCVFDPTNKEDCNLQLEKPLSSGKFKSYLKWKVVDWISEEVLGPNKEGELRVKSNYQMNGYYKSDSTAAFDFEGYIKTGDIAYYDEDNCIYVVGRVKEMFKYKGWHVVPSITEEILKAHPAIKEAVVIGVPKGTDGHHPMGVVTLQDGININVNDILNFVNGRVSDYQKLRAGLTIVKEIPKTATGKIRRRAVEKMVLQSLA